MLLQSMPQNQSIFSLPPVARRGRKARKFLPNGVQEPSRDELVQYVISHVLYQYEPGFDDGPLFCCHARPSRQRGEYLVQIVLGPPQFTGAWAIASDPRALRLQALLIPDREAWLPCLQISPGNIDPIDRLNGTDLSPAALRRAILLHRWITEDTMTVLCSQTPPGGSRPSRLLCRGSGCEPPAGGLSCCSSHY